MSKSTHSPEGEPIGLLLVDDDSGNAKPMRLLLVDDDDGDAKSVRRAFRRANIGNEVFRAVDGLDALELLKGANGKQKLASPLILLVDINMPRMDGHEFIQALRTDEELRYSIIFVLTTSNRDEDRMAAYDLSVAGYILKETAGKDFRKLVSLLDCYWGIVELPLPKGRKSWSKVS